MHEKWYAENNDKKYSGLIVLRFGVVTVTKSNLLTHLQRERQVILITTWSGEAWHSQFLLFGSTEKPAEGDRPG